MKLLVIGAHPDDNEFQCGGIAYKYKQLGHEVQFLTVCDGCRGHQSMTLEETRERRRVASARIKAIIFFIFSSFQDLQGHSG